MRRKHLGKWIVLCMLALGWAALLFFFAGQTKDDSSALSSAVSKMILRAFPFLPLSHWELSPIIRKLAHFGMFAAEGFLVGLASMAILSDRTGSIVSLTCCAGIAVLNEYSQNFAAGRSCKPIDMLIDFAGAALGVLLAALARRRFRGKN